MSKNEINFTHDPDNVLNAFLSMSRNFFNCFYFYYIIKF